MYSDGWKKMAMTSHVHGILTSVLYFQLRVQLKNLQNISGHRALQRRSILLKR